MKLKKVALFGAVFLLLNPLFSEDANVTDVREDASLEEVSDGTEVSLEESDDYELDEWDDFFSDAQDVDSSDVDAGKDKGKESGTVVNNITQVIGNTNISISGHFDADLGLVLDIDEIIEQKKLGFPQFFVPVNAGLSFGNSFYVTVRPSDDFQFYTSFTTSLGNNFSWVLDSFSFNYVPFGNIFLSAGLKSIYWDYTRIFGDTDYYGSNKFTGPLYTNVLSDAGSYIVTEARYPWYFGTLDAIVMFNRSTKNMGLREMSYAGSIEGSIPHWTFNTYIRTYGLSEKSSFTDAVGYTRSARKNPLVGIQAKSSYNGYDSYAQLNLCVKNKENYNWDAYIGERNSFNQYAVLTTGFYKLWDASDPHVGINIEYQWYCAPGFESNDNQHRTAFQGGIKRMGKNKNLKTAIDWYHNWTEMYGQASWTFGVNNIVNYGSLGTTFKVQYGQDLEIPVFSFAVGISVDIDY